MAVDGGCEMYVVHRMNEGYKAWIALKSAMSKRELGINARKSLYEKVPTALHSAYSGMRKAESVFTLHWALK